MFISLDHIILKFIQHFALFICLFCYLLSHFIQILHGISYYINVVTSLSNYISVQINISLHSQIIIIELPYFLILMLTLFVRVFYIRIELKILWDHWRVICYKISLFFLLSFLNSSRNILQFFKVFLLFFLKCFWLVFLRSHYLRRSNSSCLWFVKFCHSIIFNIFREIA